MGEVPWLDPAALVEYIAADVEHVTPLMLERLLEHCGFQEVGTVPTATGTKCVLWAHQLRDRHPQLVPHRVLVYQTTLLSSLRVMQALDTIRTAGTILHSCGVEVPDVTFQKVKPHSRG